MLNLTLVSFLLMGYFHGIDAMGLCMFARKFPNEEKHRQLSSTHPGKIVSSKIPNNQTTVYSPTPGTASTGQKLTYQVTDAYKSITTVPVCPLNMVYANCTECEGTCMNPKSCDRNCSDPETCVCPNGHLMKEHDCVSEEDCGCFIEGGKVIPEGEVYVSPNCSNKCSCFNDQLSCEDEYQCSLNAICEERNNVLQCYCNAGYAGDGVECTAISDCQEVYERVSTESGVYKIKPTMWQGEPFDVYCNMTDGGGWTVFQRRVNGSQSFFLRWSDYKNGFGTPDHELWLGNDKLHSLTTQKTYQLRIDLVNIFGRPYYAKHDSFSISDESDKYRLSIGDYIEGNTGDGLINNDRQAFTTRDRDNDGRSNINCADHRVDSGCDSFCSNDGAWWYATNGICSDAHLNSPYGTDCFRWGGLSGSCNIKYTEMKVRPI